MSDSDVAVTVDVAGASSGGAARFLSELDAWLKRDPRRQDQVKVIGREQRLTPNWLISREVSAHKASHRVALNNASFSGPGGERTVLLRNALHFCAQRELDELGFKPTRELRAQIPVIRALAHRADRIVVPCTAMRDRVLAHAPKLESRITVRAHPVSQPRWRSAVYDERKTILVPIVPQPYKNLDQHILALQQAIRGMGLTIVATAKREQLPMVTNLEGIQFVGLLPAGELDQYWEKARAVYYPTGLEAFGYPLAEARVGGRWIIARNTDQNHEIAGPALAPYTVGNVDSLREAVKSVMRENPVSDISVNDPNTYFEWLLGVR